MRVRIAIPRRAQRAWGERSAFGDQLGERRLRRSSDAVQFQIEFGPVSVAQLGQFTLEFVHPTAQPCHFERKYLFVVRAYVANQGACHAADPSVHPDARAGTNTLLGRRSTIHVVDVAGWRGWF
jgi:hypothetical protein